MATIAELAKERTDMYLDLYNGNVPSRVPVNNPLTLDAMFQYADASIAELYWDMSKSEAIFEKVCTDFYGDNIPGGTRRYPSFYQLLGYKAFVMASTGHLQRPEVHGMEEDEYDALIANPLDFMVETVLPRLCTELDTTPELRSLAMAKAFKAWTDEFMTVGMIMGKIQDKFGFPKIARGQSLAPFDCVADFLRGFAGATKDLYRIPEKVKAACEAVTPLLIKRGQFPFPADWGITMIPLHMAPYLRTKDAELYFFPTLIKVVKTLKEMGISVDLSLQVKYDRFIDYLQDLPENTLLIPEQSDDYQNFKNKLGKKYIITGLYPVALLMTGTKEQCIDKAKEMLDIFAPGGGYIFGFDKAVLDLTGNTEANLKAVLEYVYANGSYSAAERAGNVEIKPKTHKRQEILTDIEANIKSKYYTSWIDYKQAHPELYQGKILDSVIGPKLDRYENLLFSFIINKVC